GSAPVTLAPVVTVSDPDNLDLRSATVSITGGVFANDGDVLTANVGATGITASYNSTTETLLLTGSDTLANYQQVLDSVTFNSGSNRTNYDSNPIRTVVWVLDDGVASNNLSTVQTTTVSLTAVNNPPTLSNVAVTAQFTQNGAAATLSGNASVADVDN